MKIKSVEIIKQGVNNLINELTEFVKEQPLKQYILPNWNTNDDDYIVCGIAYRAEHLCILYKSMALQFEFFTDWVDEDSDINSLINIADAINNN